MINPQNATSVVKEAYKVGAKELGTVTQQITHIDTDTDWKVYGVKQAVGSHPSLEPGQVYHHHGATVANPQRSDIEVETVIGKKKYDPKPDPRSKEEILLNASKADTKIDKLEAMILQQGQIITAFMAGKNGGQNTGEQSDKPIENNVKPVTNAVTETAIESPAPLTDSVGLVNTNFSMEELRIIAKPYGIKTARMSKEKLIEAINYAKG